MTSQQHYNDHEDLGAENVQVTFDAIRNPVSVEPVVYDTDNIQLSEEELARQTRSRDLRNVVIQNRKNAIIRAKKTRRDEFMEFTNPSNTPTHQDNHTGRYTRPTTRETNGTQVLKENTLQSPQQQQAKRWENEAERQHEEQVALCTQRIELRQTVLKMFTNMAETNEGGVKKINADFLEFVKDLYSVQSKSDDTVEKGFSEGINYVRH